MSGQLHETLQDLIDLGQVPGVAAALWSTDTATGASCAEYATYGTLCHDTDVAVNEHSQFLVGSITKTYTATLVAQLHEQCVIDIDAPVVEYLPQFRLQRSEFTPRVLVRHLVQHQGGWRGDIAMRDGWEDSALEGHLELVEAQESQFRPGDGFAYSNSGSTVAGLLVQKVLGQPYEAVVHERLLAPLGMGDSVMLPWDIDEARLVRGHRSDGSQIKRMEEWGIQRDQGPAGTLISSARDQLLWARYHLDGSCTSGNPPLTDTARLAMRTPLNVHSRDGRQPGFGWSMGTSHGAQFIGHSGNIGGAYLSTMRVFPDLGAALVVLTSSSRGGALCSRVVDRVLEKTFGLPTDPPLPRFSEIDLAVLTGTYEEFVVSRGDDETLLIQESAEPDDAPTQVVLVSSDEFASVGTPSQRCGGFSTDADGVSWLHHGSRMYRRA